ncbi:MAG: DUF4920 domain-containing protein [Verrucomicrobiota bacterium]|jgi:hypothetical protein|nr:DUF4920 domain-containing protein [Verrucomicrobiota bacterium]
MKKRIAILATALSVAAAAAVLTAGCGKKDAGATAGGEHYGEPFSDAPVVALTQLLDTPDAFARKAVRVKGTIERQCPMSGCWFFINDSQGHSIKIELGDYLPKLPQNVGNTAEVEGEWIKKGDAHEFIGTRVTFTKKTGAA